MITLPQDGTWTQRNRSDIFGDLQGSFNMDFVKVLGKSRTTRMLQTTTQATNTDLTSYPVGFRYFNSSGTTNIWTVAGSKAHFTTPAVANAGFTVDGTYSGSPVDCDSTLSDIEIFGSLLCITANSKLYTKSGGNWSSNSFGGGGPWPMTPFTTQGTARLFIGVAGLSKVYSTSDGTTFSTSGTNTLVLDTNLRITFLRSSSNRIWIGTVNISGGKGAVFEWDGVVSAPTNVYRIESQGALACVIKDDLPWVVDANGRLLQFSNGTFSEVSRFPVDEKILLNATSSTNNRFIHPNGMTIINGKINILMNNVLTDNASSIPEFCPSGIWEYDDLIYNQYTGATQGTGLYHKYAFSYTPTSSNTITDYGQNRISGAGALSDMKVPNTTATATGNLIAGATLYTNASSTNVGIFTNDTFDATSGTTGQYNTIGGGYIVTTKQFAQNTKGGPSIKNAWQNVYTLYRKMLTSSSKIVVKYRTVDSTPVECSITWTSTTTFTTSTNVLGLEGYEVEGIQGTGAGYLSHISQIDVTGATYTVTVADAFTGATGTAKVRLQNWKKISTVQNQVETYDQAGIGDITNWVQLKIHMLFSGKDELEKLIIINEDYQPAR